MYIYAHMYMYMLFYRVISKKASYNDRVQLWDGSPTRHTFPLDLKTAPLTSTLVNTTTTTTTITNYCLLITNY